MTASLASFITETEATHAQSTAVNFPTAAQRIGKMQRNSQQQLNVLV
jgi:hypothetical protein